MARVDKLTPGDTADTGTNVSPKGAGKTPYAKKRGSTTIIDTPSMTPPHMPHEARLRHELIHKKHPTGHVRKGR